MKHLMIYMLFLLAATSCGLSEDSEKTEDGYVDLRFALEISDNQLVTMGLRSYSDNAIRNIDVLIFDENNKFIERVKVNNISGSATTKNFQLRTRATSFSRTFHIVANGRDENDIDVVNFSSITSNMLESNGISSLVTNALDPATSPQLPLVMWGRATSPGISTSTTLGTIKLLRAVAAISVECAAGLTDFNFTGFTIQNTSRQGRVAPIAYTLPAVTPSTPSPVSLISYIAYVSNTGSGDWSIAQGNVTPDLYLYERTNILDNVGLSVIVRANYKGVDGYYKIWLKDNTGQVINIVRNHRYLIRINKVFGPGYDTITKALSATYSSNIFVDIIDNDNDIVDMIAGGKFELGVSSPFTMNGIGQASIGVVLSTNNVEPTTVTSDVAWLTNLQLVGSGNRKTLTGTFAGIDQSITSRSGTITVQCGTLVRLIKVTQVRVF